MSYYRPPQASPWLVWAGRTVALGGIALGIASYASGVGLPGISEGLQAIGNAAGVGEAALVASEAFTPLLLGTFGSLAVWRSTEKADQVRRDNAAYRRGLNDALNQGLSDIPLPARLLSRQGQVSWLTSSAAMTVGALLCIAGAFSISGGLLGLLSSYGPGALVMAGGLGLTAMGYTAWRVGSIAAEAREFAHSTEASAERGRVLEAEAAKSAQQEKELSGLAPAAALPRAVTPPTPLTDQFRQDQAMQAILAAQTPQSPPRGFLARLMGERQQVETEALQR